LYCDTEQAEYEDRCVNLQYGTAGLLLFKEVFMEKRVEMQLGGRRLVLETGRLAKQANAAVMVRYGDTAVLCTVTASSEPKDLDFFPLTVNYEVMEN